MLFKDEHDFSLLPKIVFMTAVSCASLLEGYLVFVDKGKGVPIYWNGMGQYEVIMKL